MLTKSLLQYRLDDLEREVRKRMQGHQGPVPENLDWLLLLLSICQELPETVLGPSPVAQTLRNDLAKFVVRFPNHAGAALLCLHRKPRKSKKVGPSHSLIIREYLLMESDAILSDGKSIPVADATDGELALAIAEHYRRMTGREEKIPVRAVKDERQRLEGKYGKPKGSLVLPLPERSMKDYLLRLLGNLWVQPQ